MKPRIERLAEEEEKPVKVGLLVIGPDETVLGAWVKRDDEDWTVESLVKEWPYE